VGSKISICGATISGRAAARRYARINGGPESLVGPSGHFFIKQWSA